MLSMLFFKKSYVLIRSILIKISFMGKALTVDIKPPPIPTNSFIVSECSIKNNEVIIMRIPKHITSVAKKVYDLIAFFWFVFKVINMSNSIVNFLSFHYGR